MLGSVILEVAIALGLLYVVLSITASALTEAISKLVSLRARTLRATIRKLMGGADAEGRVKEVLAHPLIRGIGAKRRFAGNADEVPDYIPARSFATALFDAFSFFGRPGAPKTPEELTKQIDQIEPESMRRTLQGLMHEAGADLTRLRGSVEQWYESAMARARSMYAARVQTITLVVALVVVAFLNADSIMFSNQIWSNGNLRTVLVSQAEGLDFEQPNGGLSLEETVALFQFFPLGWSADHTDPRGWPLTFAGILTKIGGLLMTALAVSMGAPFWFDILNRLVNLRSAGKAAIPDRTPEPAIWAEAGPERASAPEPWATPPGGAERPRPRDRESTS